MVCNNEAETTTSRICAGGGGGDRDGYITLLGGIGDKVEIGVYNDWGLSNPLFVLPTPDVDVLEEVAGIEEVDCELVGLLGLYNDMLRIPASN